MSYFEVLLDSKNKAQFIKYSIIKLDVFKHNYLIANKKYILYLLNIPDNLLISFCLEQIGYYYYQIFNRKTKGVFIYDKKYDKYELVSLHKYLCPALSSNPSFSSPSIPS